MFLIELVQDLHVRLVGSKIFFRAIITEGEFVHEQMQNVRKFYGKALVDCYNDEKTLPGTGLFLDVKLREWNQIFSYYPSSDRYDFIYLTHSLSKSLHRNGDLSKANQGFTVPLPGELIEDTDSDYNLYPEIMHLREVHDLMLHHPVPAVRAKYEATWKMYVQGYPGLIEGLLAQNMNPNALSEIDWSYAEKRFREDSDWA